MIFAICILLIFLGMMATTMDLFIPITPATGTLIALSNMTGLMFIVLGAIILGIRGHQSRMTPFFDMPSTGHTINFHHRRGKNPNVSIEKGKLLDLEYIKAKNKIFKDTGGGFRLAGHDCRNTYETIPFDIPHWVSDYFYQLKTVSGIRDSEDFYILIESLRTLKRPMTDDPYKQQVELEKQLDDIELLKPILNDYDKKMALLDMGYDRLKRLEFICVDGFTHHCEEIEDFIDAATPNELDALIKQEFLNDHMQEANYKEPGHNFDYSNLVPIAVGMFIAALATIVLMSYFGG